MQPLDLSFIKTIKNNLSQNMKPNPGAIAKILDLRSHCIGKKVAIIGDIHGCYDELNELLMSLIGHHRLIF